MNFMLKTIDSFPTDLQPEIIETQTKNPLDELNLQSDNASSMNNSKFAIIISIIAIAAGILTGFGAYRLQNKATNSDQPSGTPLSQVAGENIKAGDVFGSPDSDTFKDSAQGYLENGGLQGEGSHHLLRPGGESQTVYLTSSVTDMTKFAGMEVKVWGETFKGQKAGWLMDVGRVEIVNTQGEAPTEE